MKALLIDSAAREIRAVEYEDYKDLQRFVGGLISTARSWDTGDVLFVDDEGLFKAQRHFFRIKGYEQPLPGNGVVVGPERYDDDGEYLGTDEPRISPGALKAEVRFLSREQADAWAKGNASEPSATVTFIGDDGKPHTEVISRYGELFGDMPQPEGESGNG